MGKFTITHEINADEETFWKVFLDGDFNTKLYKENLGFPDYVILEARETDKEIIRKVKGTPKMSLPGPVAKIMGANFSYIEEGKFDKNTKLWTWKMTPSVQPEKIRNEGTMRVEKLGATRVRRVADIVIEAKIFGIGGLIESSAEKQLREGWDESVPFMQKWIDSHK
jgi:hypothetical protein